MRLFTMKWMTYILLGRVVQSWVKITRVSTRFEFRFESFKSISVLILFVYKLMIGSSKNNRGNYQRKCFWAQEKETRVKFNRGWSAFEQLDPVVFIRSFRRFAWLFHSPRWTEFSLFSSLFHSPPRANYDIQFVHLVASFTFWGK